VSGRAIGEFLVGLAGEAAHDHSPGLTSGRRLKPFGGLTRDW
jgi:hypothetical protein